MTRSTESSVTVVCPLSSYPSSERAIPSALDTAELLGGSVEFFSAVEDPHMVGRRRDYLDQIGAQRRTTGADLLSSEVIVDPHAPRAIAERSGSADVVVVMATSTQPLMHTGYIGSAAERTTREACNPTMLVGPHNTTRLCDVKSVVVPCDGSNLSEQALVYGRKWADRLGVTLWVVTALSTRDSNKAGYRADTESNYVRRLATQVDAQWEVLHGSDPAQTIVKWAGDALIVVTSHGRSGLSRITVGSVTTAITRWATGPVLVANSRHSQAP